MITINQIQTVYQQIQPILQDENIKRYGSLLVKAGSKGAKKIIGHIEATKNNKQKLLSVNGTTNGIQTQLAVNMSGMM